MRRPCPRAGRRRARSGAGAPRAPRIVGTPSPPSVVGSRSVRGPKTLRRLRKRARRAIAPVRDRLTGATSGSDESAYLSVCRKAAQDPAALAIFKREPGYTRVLEHVTCEQGEAYLRHLIECDSSLVSRLDDFRRNDELGSPRVCDFGSHG